MVSVQVPTLGGDGRSHDGALTIEVLCFRRFCLPITE
jgi:hypothetical protein